MNKRNLKHGHNLIGCVSPTYREWRAMIWRCNLKNSRTAKNYHSKGICVCERWRDFKHFLADMGEKPAWAFCLDRIDNNKGYESGNCRWATALQHGRNTSQVKLSLSLVPRITCLAIERP